MKTWNEKTLFASQAECYAKYRLGYPDEVFDYLSKTFSLTKNSVVLDIGCGTGQVAVPLSDRVKQVIAIDAQSEMIQEGRNRSGKTNISWICGFSENIDTLVSNADLTVMARSFHWMDRKKVLEKLFPLTNENGGVALICDWKTAPWESEVQEIIFNWTGVQDGVRKIGTDGTYHAPQESHDEVLKKSAFHDFQKQTFHRTHTFSLSEVIGGLYSLSYCSLEMIGKNKEPFEQEIRKVLDRYTSGGGVLEAEITVDVTCVRK